MLPTPVEIKEKLLKALDDKSDVDDEGVLEMVSILEKYPITRATLEETKIGKMVNDLRRKIKNEKLAKRVKQLVRNWKKLLDETASVNGSPGPLHPAIAQLRSSPAVSPSLPKGSGGLSAQVQNKPSTPKLDSQKCASPALKGNKLGSVVGRSVSPAVVSNRPSTPTLVQRVSSSALPGGRPKSTPISSVPNFEASPLSRVSSEKCIEAMAVSRRLDSALGSSRTISKGMSKSISSPAISKLVESHGSVASFGHEKVQSYSPALENVAHAVRGEHEFRNLADDRSRNKDVCSARESSSHGYTVNLSDERRSNHLRIAGKSDNNQQDSDTWSNSGQLPYPYPHSHSTKVSVNSKNYIKDQRELSKTNMANRKRAREKLDSPSLEVYKKARLESSNLSENSHGHEKSFNGYTPKPTIKYIPGSVVSGIGSSFSVPSLNKHVSSPHISQAFCEDSASLTHSDNLIHQDSSESCLSAQSFDRPLRDKQKVKTTEQLIEELQKKSNSSKVGKSIITKLRTNQIEQETDLPGSVLPAGMKPRGKRGRPRKNEINVSVPSSHVKLSQVKNELVERFLETSDPSSPPDEYSPFKDDLLPGPAESTLKPRLELDTCSNSCSKENLESFSASRQDQFELVPKDESSLDAVSPPLLYASHPENLGSAPTLEEIYAQLPPVDHDIDWNAVDFFELPEQKPITSGTVDNLHNEKLPGINGIYDFSGSWSTWKQMVTLPSYEGNLLHILPYVDLDN